MVNSYKLLSDKEFGIRLVIPKSEYDVNRRRNEMKKINDFLAGIPMTIVGGVFLVLSFLLPRIGVELPVDPAWVTVFISGIPLLYLAVWRIIYNPGISKISSALLIVVAMIAVR